MNVKVVIFDWDGTLVDSVEHIAESLHLASTALGFPALERESYRDIIGLGIEEALQKLYPGISAADIAGMREGYREYFFKKNHNPAKCVCRYCRYPGGFARRRATLCRSHR